MGRRQGQLCRNRLLWRQAPSPEVAAAKAPLLVAALAGHKLAVLAPVVGLVCPGGTIVMGATLLIIIAA